MNVLCFLGSIVMMLTVQCTLYNFFPMSYSISWYEDKLQLQSTDIINQAYIILINMYTNFNSVPRILCIVRPLVSCVYIKLHTPPPFAMTACVWCKRVTIAKYHIENDENVLKSKPLCLVVK